MFACRNVLIHSRPTGTDTTRTHACVTRYTRRLAFSVGYTRRTDPRNRGSCSSSPKALYLLPLRYEYISFPLNKKGKTKLVFIAV